MWVTWGCVGVCMSVGVCVFVGVRVSGVCMHVFSCVWVYVCVGVCMSVCVGACVGICVSVCECVICMHADMLSLPHSAGDSRNLQEISRSPARENQSPAISLKCK